MMYAFRYPLAICLFLVCGGFVACGEQGMVDGADWQSLEPQQTSLEFAQSTHWAGRRGLQEAPQPIVTDESSCYATPLSANGTLELGCGPLESTVTGFRCQTGPTLGQANCQVAQVALDGDVLPLPGALIGTFVGEGGEVDVPEAEAILRLLVAISQVQGGEDAQATNTALQLMESLRGTDLFAILANQAGLLSDDLMRQALCSQWLIFPATSSRLDSSRQTIWRRQMDYCVAVHQHPDAFYFRFFQLAQVGADLQRVGVHILADVPTALWQDNGPCVNPYICLPAFAPQAPPDNVAGIRFDTDPIHSQAVWASQFIAHMNPQSDDPHVDPQRFICDVPSLACLLRPIWWQRSLAQQNVRWLRKLASTQQSYPSASLRPTAPSQGWQTNQVWPSTSVLLAFQAAQILLFPDGQQTYADLIAANTQSLRRAGAPESSIEELNQALESLGTAIDWLLGRKGTKRFSAEHVGVTCPARPPAPGPMADCVNCPHVAPARAPSPVLLQPISPPTAPGPSPLVPSPVVPSPVVPSPVVPSPVVPSPVVPSPVVPSPVVPSPAVPSPVVPSPPPSHPPLFPSPARNVTSPPMAPGPGPQSRHQPAPSLAPVVSPIPRSMSPAALPTYSFHPAPAPSVSPSPKVLCPCDPTP